MNRFWSKVAQTGNVCECWPWTASLDTSGYAQIKVDGRKVMSHRYSYEQVIGPIPDGLQLDHLCRDRSCVNPYHLEPVTQRENNLRGRHDYGGKHNRLKTRCPMGHEYDIPNTYYDSKGYRVCRKCRSRWT